MAFDLGPRVLVDCGGGAADELLLRDVLVGLAGDGGFVNQRVRQEFEIALRVGVDGRLREVLRQDIEGGGCTIRGRNARSVQDVFELTGADDCVDLGDVLPDLVAVALHQAAGDDDALGAAFGLVLDHLEDGRDRLLLGGVDEAAGVDDDDLGVFGVGGEGGSVVVEHAHHHFGVDEVFGTAKRDEADLGPCGDGCFDEFRSRGWHDRPFYQFWCRVRAQFAQKTKADPCGMTIEGFGRVT